MIVTAENTVPLGSEIQATDNVRIGRFPYWVIVATCFLGTILAVNQIFHLQVMGFMPIGTAYYYYILATFLSTVFLIFPARKQDKQRLPWYDWILFAFCLGVNIYLALNAYNILTKGWEHGAPALPTAASFVLWALSLEGIRRTGGTTLFLICGIFSFYPIYGEFMPGFLWGAPFSLIETATYHGMGVEGIIGIATRVVGDLLLGFIIFGVALVSTGGGQFFMDFAFALLGHTKGGAAKVAVISSALMASISGSAVSNVITTGSMTIPAMKRTGYEPTYAGAVEACASTGGTITPPVMGAAGFLIASFLNVPYREVILAAAFPSFLYYWTLFLQVHGHARKIGLVGMPRDELPRPAAVFKGGWYFLGAVVLLVFILGYLRVEAWAPFFVMLFLFACAILRRHNRYNWRKFTDFWFESAKLVGQITAILAGVGLIVGSLSGTGVANSFSREIVVAAGDNYLVLLVLGAVASFILGMGMTVTACYVFLAIVLVPALVTAGLHPMAAHLFVLYWGVLSYITPPVALASITAATIAGSDPMATGWQSMKLGAAKYIVPFFFAVNPSLILVGPPGWVLLDCFTAVIGCVFLAASLEGWLFYYGRVGVLPRIILFLGGFLLIYPYHWISLAGAAIVAATYMALKALRPSPA
jgi:TRAP transporter 4TM/12TM fusion protein